MCTAITYNSNAFYFGRTLDYEIGFGEKIVLTPRNYVFNFTGGKKLKQHYSVLGMARVEENYPLYFDACNEKGLCIAALNFVGNAHYEKEKNKAENVAAFELISYILCFCENVNTARKIIARINITDTPFNNKLSNAPLHWIIADKKECITVEAVKSGINVYENKVGILTNNPSFNTQLFHLNNFMNLSPKNPTNSFSEKLNLFCYSRGMGAIGLPGDFSSQSRFVRAAFLKNNSPTFNTEKENISQFFHIMDSVKVPLGSVTVENHSFDKTIYTSCINADSRVYYYTTYENRNINAVYMDKENLNGNSLCIFNLITKQKINGQN